ncbi:MAG: alpha/beta hydrolase [Myxococcales bacterium]|nr:alpha/beta hydrolase [Myxococcales bacterium]MCB9717805.1 alpha/beta hydrolase [Myxococcales bacterium]
MIDQPEEITIQTPTLRLAARAWGPADGVPVLALHGWLDSAASFDRVAPRLPGLRLVCLDMPGHGESEHLPPGQGYAFVDTVAHVHAATVALGWERFCLLGHSLGAAVSAVLAGTFPARVRRLALVEGLGPVTEEPKHAAERLARSIEEEERKRGRTPPVYPSEDEAVRRLEASMSRLSHEAARTLCRRGLRPVEGGVTWRSDPRLRLPSRLRLTEEQVLVFLGAIECPTLLVRGSEGFPFAPRPMSARVAALRDAEMVELPGGHHLHLDTPDAVAEVLREFFAPLVHAC